MPIYPPGYPSIIVRQPQPFDLVADEIDICGLASSFEANLQVRLRDGSGAVLAHQAFLAGGHGVWRHFHISAALEATPQTPQGMLEVFSSGGEDGAAEVDKVTVLVVFGSALVPSFSDYVPYAIAPGDTLSAIALEIYQDATKWPRIFEANRDRVLNPNLIYPGQILRVPQ